MSKAGAAHLRKLKGIPEKIPKGYTWKHHKSTSAQIRDKGHQLRELLLK